MQACMVQVCACATAGRHRAAPGHGRPPPPKPPQAQPYNCASAPSNRELLKLCPLSLEPEGEHVACSVHHEHAYPFLLVTLWPDVLALRLELYPFAQEFPPRVTAALLAACRPCCHHHVLARG